MTSGRNLGPRYIWNINKDVASFLHERSKHLYDGRSHDRNKSISPDISKFKSATIFQENCLLTLMRGICSRNGIVITDECSRQLCNSDGESVLGFEFVTADIVDIVPVVKHMHQVCYLLILIAVTGLIRIPSIGNKGGHG